MPRLGGADEVIIADVHLFKQRAEEPGDLVGKLLGRFAGGCGGTLHFLAVLVGAGKEVGVKAQHALAPRNGVAHQRGVCMPDVRARVHVINGRSNVKLLVALIHGLLPDKL